MVEIAQVVERLEQVDREVKELKENHMRLQQEFIRVNAALNENTQLTKRIAADTSGLIDIFKAAEGGFKVLGWMGTAIKWVASVGAAVGAFWLMMRK